MRKPALNVCENKGADQLICLSRCAARFVSDLVGNPQDMFSHDAAHLLSPFEYVYRRDKRRI